MQKNTTQNPQASTVRAVIEWRGGLDSTPVIYTIGDTAEQSELIERLLTEKLGEPGHVD